MPELSHSRGGTDLNVRLVVGAALLLLAVIAVVLAVMTLFAPPPGGASVGDDLDRAPFEGGSRPGLSVDPARELEELRAEEDERLQSYSWVDRERGIVGIPIEQAMKLLVEEGEK
jgi:uncharacterized protein (DUF58 family)